MLIKLNQIFIQKYLAVGSLIFFTVLPFIERGYSALRNITQATTNIYEQQYQMGLFLRNFYQGQAVAVNDIGAVNYLSDIKCLDLWGLANLEVAKLKLQGKYNTKKIYELAKQNGVKIAIVYDHWFKFDGMEGIPKQWIRVDQWKISNNVVCGGDVVSFYAVDSGELDNLIKNIRAFSSRLPKNVITCLGD